MVHGDVIFLQVGENARREAVRHHLPIVAARGAKVAQLDLRAQSAQHHRLHVRDGEAVRAQVAEHLKCAQTIRDLKITGLWISGFAFNFPHGSRSEFRMRIWIHKEKIYEEKNSKKSMGIVMNCNLLQF